MEIQIYTWDLVKKGKTRERTAVFWPKNWVESWGKIGFDSGFLQGNFLRPSKELKVIKCLYMTSIRNEFGEVFNLLRVSPWEDLTSSWKEFGGMGEKYSEVTD